MLKAFFHISVMQNVPIYRRIIFLHFFWEEKLVSHCIEVYLSEDANGVFVVLQGFFF